MFGTNPFDEFGGMFDGFAARTEPKHYVADTPEAQALKPVIVALEKCIDQTRAALAGYRQLIKQRGL